MILCSSSILYYLRRSTYSSSLSRGCFETCSNFLITYSFILLWGFPLATLNTVWWDCLLFLALGIFELLPIDPLILSKGGARLGSAAVLVSVSGGIFFGYWSYLEGLASGPLSRCLKLVLIALEWERRIQSDWLRFAN